MLSILTVIDQLACELGCDLKIYGQMQKTTDNLLFDYTAGVNRSGNTQDIIDKRVSELLSKQGPSEVQKGLDKGESTKKHQRYSKFQHLCSSVSGSSDDSEDDRDVVCINKSAHEFEVADSCSEASQSASSAPGILKVDWKDFVSRVASYLSIPVKEKSCDSKYKPYVAEHLPTPKELRQFILLLEGSIVHGLEEVEKELQDKGRIRCFRSDQKKIRDLIGEKSDKISTRKPGRFRMLQHVLCSSEEGQMSFSNLELDNSECSP